MRRAAGIWWLASYPKSGSTWLRAVIATLLTGGPVDINAMGFLGRISGDRFGFDDALGLDSADLTPQQQVNLRPRAYDIWAAEATRPLYCKAHDAYHATPAGEPLFPAAATLGAVYIVRDPRAVAVSLAHHTRRSLDEAIAAMADPATTFATAARGLRRQLPQRLGRWDSHVESWLSAPFPVHLLRYEDMHTDAAAACAGVAAFLGLPSDAAAVAMAVEATHFSRLQAHERAAGFVERPFGVDVFFREGRVDGWRRELDRRQTAQIVAEHGAVMRRLGYLDAEEG